MDNITQFNDGDRVVLKPYQLMKYTARKVEKTSDGLELIFGEGSEPFTSQMRNIAGTAVTLRGQCTDRFALIHEDPAAGIQEWMIAYKEQEVDEFVKLIYNSISRLFKMVEYFLGFVSMITDEVAQDEHNHFPASQSAPKYAIGERVEMKTYNEARGTLVPDANGNIEFGGLVFNADMIQYAGTDMTVANVITAENGDPNILPELYPVYEMEEDGREWPFLEAFIKRKAR